MSVTHKTRTLVRACVLACAFIAAAPAAARSIAVNQSTLVQGMNAAQPGDTIVLAPGGYGVIAVPRKVWQQPITIDARAASMTGIVMFKVSGVNWTGGTIIGSLLGISISNSDRVNITGADVSGAIKGIVVNNSSDIKLLRNKLHALRSDGIDVVGQRVLVEGNTITDMRPVAGDHPDGIQIWSANDEQTRDITVRGNSITGASQGIFARAPALGLSNLVVTGNKVFVDYGNGIVLLDTKDSIATGNSVKSTTNGQFDKANMRVEGYNNMACSNVVPDVPKAPAAQVCVG
ncbi:hypothetical protein SPAN111604_12670 [Sphingomonas antarctica]|uniref:right-handed parallel beta-helix repeat-containing protein n=1 Tax=Sphingomonas antarctica TaxID=2040274 RepID=UPI0039EB546E